MHIPNAAVLNEESIQNMVQDMYWTDVSLNGFINEIYAVW